MGDIDWLLSTMEYHYPYRLSLPDYRLSIANITSIFNFMKRESFLCRFTEIFMYLVLLLDKYSKSF